MGRPRKDFKNQIRKEVKRIEDDMWGVLHTALLRTFEDSVRLCPVWTGYLRNHIYLEKERRSDLALTKDRDENASYPLPKRPRLGKWDSYVLGDNAEYAEAVEYHGLAKTAPAGFMRIALANFPKHVQAAKAERGRPTPVDDEIF